MDENLVPVIVRVDDMREETPDIRSIKLVFEDEQVRRTFEFKAGQFCLISAFGAGEAPFCICSPPAYDGCIEVAVKNVGKVTAAIHDLEIGDKAGFRGPYGNSFDLEGMRGRDILLAGGGIGLAPLRPVVHQVLADREAYGKLGIVYGARSVRDIPYRRELDEWRQRDDIQVVLTVDPGGEDSDWKGEVGLVPRVLEKVNPSPDSILIAAGPPIMLKYVFITARKLGFRPADLITTLEMKMKCGVGLCGRCNVGSKYVCRHGPVFSLEEVDSLPDEF